MLRKDLRKSLPSVTGTADPAEIARFNAQADEWRKPDGAFKMIHIFNRARVGHLAQRLPLLLGRDPSPALPLAGVHILDVGCGAGLVTEAMSLLGATVLGIDAAERNILVAARHAGSIGSTVEYRHALPEELVEAAGQFDVVLSLEVVEHVIDVPQFLEALARLVAPGGLLVIGTLNRTLRSFVKAILGAEYVFGWLPRGTHNWRKFVTPRELESRLGQFGFDMLERCGVIFAPLSKRWCIGKDVSATYLQFHRRR
jgi:2-polyprenyl-6-hydroxyphenyl methylase/3-demethylubiquinone-9 3-methyltransferase